MGPGPCGQVLLVGRRALVALVACGSLGVFAASALADTTVSVNTTSDAPTAGQCSLREAVLYSDGTAEPGLQRRGRDPKGRPRINIPAGHLYAEGAA